MYKIKRFSMITPDEYTYSLSDARETLNNKKYTFFNHLILYLLLEEWREDYEDGLTWHWYKELSDFMNEALNDYKNNTIKKTFDFIELFKNFIDKSDSRYEVELKSKIREENNTKNKRKADRNITYPTKFLNSSELVSILTYLSDYWNSWVKRSGKPKLGKDDNYKDCQVIHR